VIVGSGRSHIGVVANTEPASLSSCSLNGVGVAVLRKNYCACVDKSLSSNAFSSGIIPLACNLYKNFALGINRLYAESKCVDTAGYFGVVRSLSANEANNRNAKLLSLETCSYTGKVTSLINSAEIVVEVLAVALIA